MMKVFLALALALSLTSCHRRPSTVDAVIAAAAPIELTQAEKEYVASHEVVMGYQKNIEPIISDRDGKPFGYAAKVTELIQKRTGLRMKFVLYDSNAAIVPAFIAKQMDAAMAASDVVERRSLVTVSHLYTSMNGVLVIDQLPIQFPMRVAIGSKYAVQESVAKIGGLVTFVPYESEDLGFQALMRKEVGGAIMSQAVADYLELKYKHPYAHSGMNFIYDVGYGCQVDAKVLCDILNKGIDSITPEERVIFERAFYVRPLKPVGAPVKYGPP